MKIVLGLVAALVATPSYAALIVSEKPTQNVDCSGGVCTATSHYAVLNGSDLETLLASADTTVKAAGGAQDVDVRFRLTWASTSRLTLDAVRSVNLSKPISVTGQGGLTITTNDGGQNGDFNFLDHGKVTFEDGSSSLIINGNSYALASSVGYLAALMSNGGGFIALAKDYDASGDGIHDGPIVRYPFDGTVEGLGNSIQNLQVAFTEDEGSDGFMEYNGGAIRDLGFENVSYRGYEYSDAGILAAENAALIKNCWATGTDSNGSYVAGGLVGINWGAIIDSHTNLNMSADSDDGIDVGGIAGENDGSIVRSYAKGTMSFRGNTESDGGGLVGLNKGTISDSFARNTLGANEWPGSTTGGLVGTNTGTITSSYAAGKTIPNGQQYRGGLIGADTAPKHSLKATYWDVDKGVDDVRYGAGNKQNDPGITSLTTEQFKSGLPSGFSPKVWAEDATHNGGYPYLISKPASN